MARHGGQPGSAPLPTPILRIDLDRPVPPYEQLRAQIAGLIEAGELPAGRRLASVRQLAGDLGIAPGTVARAYAELEAAGALVTRRRGGTFVADHGENAATAIARRRALTAAAESYVAAVRALGLGDEAAVPAVQQAITRPGALH